MSDTIQSPSKQDQVTVWMRGLIAIAWADGHFDPVEQAVIHDLLHQDLSEEQQAKALEPLSDAELAQLGHSSNLAENFLRMAVMVALADGDYSEAEDALILRYCQVLNQKPEAIQVLRSTFQALAAAQPSEEQPASEQAQLHLASTIAPLQDGSQPDVLHPVREWLDTMDVEDPKVARMLCKLIPSQCPFERDISLFGRKLVHIPPLCKINPLYEQLVGLRFRALSYLADDCGEDVSSYV